MAVQQLKVKALKQFAPRNAVIIDVGCGGGFLLECIRKYGMPSWKLIGNDFSEKAIEKIKAKGFKAFGGRFEALEMEPESADIIILNQVIEHLDDPCAVIAKVCHVLKKGGYIFIETPSMEGWDARLFKKRYWGGWHFPRHWTIFTKYTLGDMLKRNGFEVVDIKWLLSPNFWAQSFHHLLIDNGVPERIARIMDCKNPAVLALFSAVDLIQKLFDHTSNMRMIGQKR